MMEANSYVDWIILTWHFKINSEKITIQFSEIFFNLNDKALVYALIYSTFNVENISKVHKLFEFLKNYKNCFDFKNVKTFFEHENKNHVIDLISDAKLSYELFYIFFKIEFNILKNYLLKNLILNCIQEFTNCTSALMLFVLKKR